MAGGARREAEAPGGAARGGPDRAASTRCARAALQPVRAALRLRAALQVCACTAAGLRCAAQFARRGVTLRHTNRAIPARRRAVRRRLTRGPAPFARSFPSPPAGPARWRRAARRDRPRRCTPPAYRLPALRPPAAAVVAAGRAGAWAWQGRHCPAGRRATGTGREPRGRRSCASGRAVGCGPASGCVCPRSGLRLPDRPGRRSSRSRELFRLTRPAQWGGVCGTWTGQPPGVGLDSGSGVKTCRQWWLREVPVRRDARRLCLAQKPVPGDESHQGTIRGGIWGRVGTGPRGCGS